MGCNRNKPTPTWQGFQRLLAVLAQRLTYTNRSTKLRMGRAETTLELDTPELEMRPLSAPGMAHCLAEQPQPELIIPLVPLLVNL